MTNDKAFKSWEDAVDWLRQQPDQQDLVKACYYDKPALQAADRYWHSEEWHAVQTLLKQIPIGQALDVGAGNGIASYALARDGWETTALEPDPSDDVGGGAIRLLSSQAGLRVTVVQEFGESLPFADASFDLIHARQVLHHARNLGKFCKELFRVLRPGGMLIATREHVISGPHQLQAFLDGHALHRFYGGENAYTFKQYHDCLRAAGFKVRKVLPPFGSVINYAPHTWTTLRSELLRRAKRIPGGQVLGTLLVNSWTFQFILPLLTLLDRRPGRLYSFVVQRPRVID